MPFSSLPRRIAIPLSSWPSYRWLRCTRFATTVSNLSALEERVNDDPVEVRDASKRVFPLRATEHGIDSGRSSEPSITESYLLSLLTDGTMPTLHDLERLKPSEHSDPRSTAYASEYKALLDNICRSFSNDQLRSFSQQYGLQLGSRRKKKFFAEAIVEKAWHWPPFRELKRARDRTEVASQTLALASSELFILLGKDGSDLLQLSRRYNVHISVKRNPLAIYLEGSRESVEAVEKYVGDVRKSIVEDIVDTPSAHPVSQEVLQRVSRLSGAFVENAGSQKLRLRAKHPTNIMLAQRLAVRLHYETEPSELLAQRMHDQEFHTPTAAPVAYALYPFAAPRSLSPIKKSNTFFRWRRVGDWLGDTRSQSLGISGLAHPQSNISSMDGTEVRLRQRLTENASMPSYGSTRLISALSGHILFPASRIDARPSLLTPRTGGPGGSTYSDTHSWVSTQQMSATFVPSLPFALVKAVPSQQRVLHRLVYGCFPALEQHKRDSLATHLIRLEVPLVDLKQTQLPLGASGGSVLANTLFWGGSSTNLDILMPDRLMDLRFTISDMNPLTFDRLPGEILNYLNDLENFLTSSDSEVVQPVPPLHISYDNQKYVLVTNASVRQSMESPSYDPSPGIAVTSESTLDLESGHHSAVCVSKISSDNLDSPQEWNDFLQSCDQMTARAGPR